MARTTVRDSLKVELEGQIDQYHQKKEEDCLSQRTKVATAFEELAERFPRKRYKTKAEKQEHQDLLLQTAVEKSAKKIEEKEAFDRECANRNEYLQQCHEQLMMTESLTKLRDRNLMKSVWFNQTERGQAGKSADMLASLI